MAHVARNVTNSVQENMVRHQIFGRFRILPRIGKFQPERRLIYDFRFRTNELTPPIRDPLPHYATKTIFRLQILRRFQIWPRIGNIPTERRVIYEFRFRSI